MKNIFAKVFLAFLMLIVADRTLGYVFQKFFFEKTLSGESGGNINYLIQQKKDASLIILGSSRAKRQIDPGQLTTISGVKYNAGVNGSGKVLYNDALLEIILKNNIRPKYLIFQTDLINYIEISKKNELIYLYPYYGQSHILHDYVKSKGYEEELKIKLSLYKYNGKLLNIGLNYFKRNSVKDNNGFVPLKQVLDSTALAPARINNKESSLIPYKLNALNNIITQCKNNNIKLFILLPPSYQNRAYKQPELNKLLSFIKSKTNEPVINMVDVTKLQNLQYASNWNDANHLNKAGAKIFSKQLNDSLAKYIQMSH